MRANGNRGAADRASRRLRDIPHGSSDDAIAETPPRAASEDHRSVLERIGGCSARLGNPRSGCRRSSTWPAPTARDRPSPICARSSRRQASRSTVYTSPHLVKFHERIRLGRPAAAIRRRGRARRSSSRMRGGQWRRADHVLRNHHGGGVLALRAKIPPTTCCSRSGSAAGSTRPM